MLERLIELSLKNKTLVLLLTLLGLGGGAYALFTTPLDALPDLGDTQVIVQTDFRGQSPRVVEDQVTYPLTSALVSVPGSKTVRGYSFFGYSLVYVLFEDGTDPYWARSRVSEYLNSAQKRLPPGVVPNLGPDGTGVGWIFEYALVSDSLSLQELRSLQDWYLKYELSGVEDVSEVAAVGGFVKEYQVNADPAKLGAYGVSLDEVERALRAANQDAGGETVEMGESEFMLRGLGRAQGADDLRSVPLRTDARTGIPVRVGDVADVTVGAAARRGLAELDGRGEVVGGVVILRPGANALKVIGAVKRKLEQLRAGLPGDVRIVPTYDRSALIRRAVDNLRAKLIEEMLIVAAVCALFLLHARSALVAVITLPAAVLMAFAVMRLQGLSANIMSLGGIAVAVGAMVDGAVILVENAHKHLEAEAAKTPAERRAHGLVILEACKEVGPTLFWSLLVITVSFLPVFTLEAQEGRLFRPLAFTKTYAMAASAVLAVTLVPVLMAFFLRGNLPPEDRNPVNRFLIRAYHPVVRSVLRKPVTVLAAAAALIAVSWLPFHRLGSEFMPPLFEGDLLYMPTTLPGVSVTKAREILQQTDKIIASFPEVEQVFGKIGRAETATDPAGLDMVETTVRLKPEKRWRPGMTVDKLVAEMDAALKFPGLTNSWTLPIKNRVDMQSTGLKTPVGLKISGPDQDTLQAIGREAENLLRGVTGTASAFAERASGGNYLDIRIDREKAARYGVNIGDAQAVIQSALGGMDVGTVLEGLQRYSVTLRYSRELRDNPEDIKRALVSGPGGQRIPLGEIADVETSKGPMLIRSENARPNAWVFVDVRGRDIGSYVKEGRAALAKGLRLPQGYSLAWSGEFESMQRADRRLMLVIPLTLFLIVILLYMNTRSMAKTAIVLAAIPFSLVGAVWLTYLLGYNLSVAVWVGMIALAGLDAETGAVMLLYLDKAYESLRARGLMRNRADLRLAIDEGAVRRVRPKIMTASVILAGLIPILWSHGAGSDVMKRIAAPMVGGVITSVLMELAVYPVVYYLWRGRKLRERV